MNSKHDAVPGEPFRVFISYRRDSDLLRAKLVALHVHAALGEGGGRGVRIFIDTRMRVGEQWPSQLEQELAAADVVLVLIGPGWLAAKDAFSRRRIDQADDWVRREIETALRNGTTIVPVAFEEPLPLAEGLPASLAGLLDWQAAVVHDWSMERDLEPLISELLRLVAGRGEAQPTSPETPGRLPYPDPPMRFPPPAMPEEELRLVVHEELPSWDIVTHALGGDGSVLATEIHRAFQFRSFRDVIGFVADVAEFAEKSNHHPRWQNIFRTLDIYLTTWDIDHRVSTYDVLLASYLDRTYASYLAAHAAR